MEGKTFRLKLLQKKWLLWYFCWIQINLELKNFHTAEVITVANKRISQIDARIERSQFVEDLEGSMINNCYE